MLRTAFSQAFVVGLLTALASFCVLKASAAPADIDPHSVVAQSSKETATKGRRPLGQRIAASSMPIVIPTGNGGSEQGGKALGLEKTPHLVMPPIAESASEQVASRKEAVQRVEPEQDSPESEASEQDSLGEAVPEPAEPGAFVGPEPEQHSLHKHSHSHASQTVHPRKNPSAQRPLQRSQGLLLERVKSALSMKRQPAFVEADPPHPIPKGLSPMHAKAAAPRNPVPTAVYPEEHHTAEPIAVSEPIGAAESVDAGPIAAAPIAAAPSTGADDAASADGPAEPLAGVPARLEFDVRESRSLVSEGEQIVMRIAVRNVGGEPAEAVSATLFFADGMEPVQAIGHSAEVYPGEVRFGTLQAIPPGDSVDLLVTAIGTRPGSVTYRGELAYSQLPGRIAREGAVTVRARKPLKE